jgi:hypothetical protein
MNFNMTLLKKICLPAFLLACISACTTKIEEPKLTSGSADLTKFLSVGGSFTSGYTDNALYLEGQQNSFPAILVKSFSTLSTGTFLQPLVNAGVGIGLDSNAKLVLTNQGFCFGNALTPQVVSPTGDYSDYNWIGNNGPFNNIGVPGLRIYQINNQLLGNPQAGNSFYARFVKMQDNDHTILSDISEFNATFFTYWMGMDDLLPFALSGGAAVTDPVTATDFSSAVFSPYLDMMVKALVADKAKGAIANVPNILDFPYFTTIPYNGVVYTATDTSFINPVLRQTFANIQYTVGNNPFVIDDASVPHGKRFMTSNEFVLLRAPLDSIQCYHYGSYDLQNGRLNSIPDCNVINGAEATLIYQRQTEFNQLIHAAAVANNLAYVDMYDFFRHLDSGIKLNGVNFSLEFLHGGAFSLDGIHLTAKGNALVANEFIRAINAQYGANLHEADANAYPGVKFP